MDGIEVKTLSFAYEQDLKRKKVFSDLSFKTTGKESIGLIGANGVGKSTLLKLLVGLQLNYSGSIEVNGILVAKKNLTQVRKKVGYVFQDSDSQLFMSTVYDDVAFGPRNYGFPEHLVEKMVLEALRTVRIEYLKNASIFKLSGGEKKLASLATILSMQPDIILLDEPSVGLDPVNRRNLIQVMNQLSALKIIASHDLDLILDTCSRTILLFNEKIAADGNTQAILCNKDLLESNGLELPLSLYRG